MRELGMNIKTPTEDGTYARNPETSEWELVTHQTSGYWVAFTQGNANPEKILTGFLGIWSDPETGEKSFDHVIWMPNRTNAVALGEMMEQKAIWDIAAGQEIWL